MYAFNRLHTLVKVKALLIGSRKFVYSRKKEVRIKT